MPETGSATTVAEVDNSTCRLCSGCDPDLGAQQQIAMGQRRLCPDAGRRTTRDRRQAHPSAEVPPRKRPRRRVSAAEFGAEQRNPSTSRHSCTSVRQAGVSQDDASRQGQPIFCCKERRLTGASAYLSSFGSCGCCCCWDVDRCARARSISAMAIKRAFRSGSAELCARARNRAAVLRYRSLRSDIRNPLANRRPSTTTEVCSNLRPKCRSRRSPISKSSRTAATIKHLDQRLAG